MPNWNTSWVHGLGKVQILLFEVNASLKLKLRIFPYSYVSSQEGWRPSAIILSCTSDWVLSLLSILKESPWYLCFPPSSHFQLHFSTSQCPARHETLLWRWWGMREDDQELIACHCLTRVVINSMLCLESSANYAWVLALFVFSPFWVCLFCWKFCP